MGTLEKIDNATFFELIEMFNNAIKSFPEINLNESKKLLLSEPHNNYSKIDIKGWSPSEKEVLFTYILRGLNFFYFIYSEKKSLPISGFNSVMDAIRGEDSVFISTKSIKRLPNNLKYKIRLQGINIED